MGFTKLFFPCILNPRLIVIIQFLNMKYYDLYYMDLTFSHELLEPESESVFCPKCEIGHRRKNNAFLIVMEFPSSYCYEKCYAATSGSANHWTG